MYVELGSENGGFPINISEDGMAFQGVRRLQKNQEICVTFKFHGIDESVTAMAKIVWLSGSRKGGGLQFIDLPESSRRLINDWMALQTQAGSPEEKSTSVRPHVESKGIGSTHGVPWWVAEHGNCPTVATTIVATKPPSPSPLPAGEANPANTPDVNPKAELDDKKTLPGRHSQHSTNLKRPSQISTPFTTNEKKSTWIKSYGFVFGPAISIATMIISVAMLWPLHGILLAHFVSGNPSQPDSQPASASSAALPSEQTVVEEPSRDPATIESLPLTAVADEPGDLTKLVPPNAMMSAPSYPAKNTPFFAPQAINGTTSRVPPLAVVDFHLPAPVPAQSEQSVTAPPNPAQKDMNEPPVTVNAGGKTSPLPAKPAETSVSATGSIEIISDAYPSIRVPAESKARLPRPGSSLQIGRLVTKIEPIYPQEALRQRMAGTAKVHVVIGRNGIVDKAELLDGPALLAEAVLQAVQQWHYAPTLLGSEPIEVEEDITVVFRITSPPATVD